MRGYEKEQTREKKAKNQRGGAGTKGDGAKRSGRFGFERRVGEADEKSIIIIITVERATIINHH